MGKHPISLVLIVYNTKEFINACLDSIASQTFADFELVVINNNSDDKTTRFLQNGLKQFGNRVKYLYNEKNVGGAEAGNQGIKTATSPYVFLMDSDDVLPRQSMYHLNKCIEKSQYDVVIGRGKSIIGNRIYNNKYSYDAMTWSESLEVESLLQAPYLVMAPFYWGKLYRRDFLIENNIFMKSNRINADRYFNSKALLFSKKTIVITDECYWWRRHSSGNSITNNLHIVDYFIDRMKSTMEVDRVFEQYADYDCFLYTKLAGLLRLYLPIEQTLINDEFASVYFDLMHNYLSEMSIEDICNCDFIPSKVKIFSYLIKKGFFDTVLDILSKKIRVKCTKEEKKIIYIYEGLEYLPDMLFFEPVHKIENCIATFSEEHSICKGEVIGYLSADFKPLAIFLMDDKRCEITKIPFYYDSDTNIFTFSFSKKMFQLFKRKKLYYITLQYRFNAKIGRIPLTYINTNAVFVLGMNRKALFKKNCGVILPSNKRYRFTKNKKGKTILSCF